MMEQDDSSKYSSRDETRLNSAKTGGYPENCGYCSESARNA